MARRPNLFLVGAPRSGTTALRAVLHGHPQIFMAGPREPHFFAQDLSHADAIGSLEAYLALFKKSTSAHTWVGEKSVWYLYSRAAAAEIKRFSPQAKILVLLRNPVDVLYSLHSEMLYELNEDLTDFAEALEAEPDRKEGRRIPARAHFIGGLLYRETVRFPQQVRRFLDAFGHERVHVILFEDFTNDMATAYRKTLAFLGVSPNHGPALGPRPLGPRPFGLLNRGQTNPNKRFRSRLLHRLLARPPGGLRGAARRVPLAGIWQTLLRGLMRANTRFVPRPPMDRELRERLQRSLAPEVEALGELLGRDLSQWIRVKKS